MVLNGRNRKKSADDTPEEVSTVNDKERRPKLAVKFYDFNTIYYFVSTKQNCEINDLKPTVVHWNCIGI